MRYSRPVGYTLVELMAAVAILGLLAAVAISQGLKVLERSRQAKAMDDMKDMAAYIAARLSILGTYPSPLTIRTCPTCPWVPYERKDPWGHFYVYSGGGDTYTLRCLGRDGKPSAGITFETRDAFDRDIVMTDGHFVSQPFTR